MALDARTGKTIRTYSFGGSDRSWPPRARVAYHNGILLTGAVGVIEAYDAKSGKGLWHKRVTGEKYVGLSPLALHQSINQKRIVAEGKVFVTLSKTKEFLCLDLNTGTELWRVSSQGDRLVCYRQGILFSQYSERGKNKVFNAAYSPTDGALLWRHHYDRVWHGGNPHNMFFLAGLVWVLASIPSDDVPYSKEPQVWHGLNPTNGAVVRRIPWDKTKHRCYGDRATEHYILSGGMDFLEVETGKHSRFLGGRGSCSFGHMPANGLVYQLPNVCQCYSQVRGVVAFAADVSTPDRRDEQQGLRDRQTGNGTPAEETPSPDDWPMFRHGPARSGSTTAVLPSELTRVWEREIGGRLSSPVAACGKVFVSSIDQHRVIALDMKTGGTVWSYTANGRVDSPPTIHAGRALFGCRDGWLYSVSSATGELIWCFQAAPRQRWLVCRGQVESAWPVHGSVLIDSDTAYFSAGRHSHVDGGVVLYAASPKTGEILWRKRLDADSLKPTYHGPGNIANDILVSNGKIISLQRLGFDPATGSQSDTPVSFWSGTGGGFLTDIVKPIVGWHDLAFRQWRHSASRTKGLTLAFSVENVYGVRTVGDREKPWNANGYELFSCSKDDSKKTFWQAALPKGVVPKAILHTRGRLYVAAGEECDGPRKGTLVIHDAKDGRSLGAIHLDVRPQFDGLAAVNRNLILVGQDGKVICFSKDGLYRSGPQ